MSKIGFTAGNFDLLHPGYIYTFEEAKKHCDTFFVFLHADPSEYRNNKYKPVVPLYERYKTLMAIKYIDAVYTYKTEEELLDLIIHWKPDIRILGEDYIGKSFTGDELPIEVIYTTRSHEWSTTKIKNLIITALGGPFINHKPEDLKKVTSVDAVKHPTWDMGKKISVDSSTMMNKGFEIIEAKLLFNINIDNIKALIHRQSKVHAFIEFFDGTIISHMSNPDMKIPISYAITYPERIYNSISDGFLYDSFSFETVPLDKFPCYWLARNVADIGKNTGLILNAANEISVEYFLENKISFLDIPNIIEYILETSEFVNHNDFQSLIDNDNEIRISTKNYIKYKYL